MLVNEIGPHLPIYCWGSALHRVLEGGAAGSQIQSAIHGSTVQEIVKSLASPPLSIPLGGTVHRGLGALLDLGVDGFDVHRRVREIVPLQRVTGR